jgi:hypothetical protein
LLEEYLKRRIFWEATESRVPVEWAGNRLLGVKKVRAYEIIKELEECDGPCYWFRETVLQQMRKGKLPRGRETQKSKMADAFFLALAGDDFDYLKPELGCNPKVDLEELRRNHEEIDREILDYVVYSQLVWRDGE